MAHPERIGGPNRSRDRTERGPSDTLLRLGAFAGAAALVGLAASRRSALAVSGATAVAIPLVVRGATGHWPLESVLAHPVWITKRITIRREASEIWDYWRQLENLPRFMRHLERVVTIDQDRSHWVARTPLGEVEWDAEIIDAQRGKRLEWRSIAGSPIETWGRLELEPSAPDRGTLLCVEIALDPPHGRAGRVAATLLQPVTGIEIREDLRRFKALMEAGEIPTIAGQSHGARAHLLGVAESSEAAS